MKTVWFECYIHGFEGWDEEVDLTSDEYDRLIDAMKKGEEFFDCEEIADIYKKVYSLVVSSATANFMEFMPEVVAPYVEENKNWKADDTYFVGVNFPEYLYEEIES